MYIQNVERRCFCSAGYQFFVFTAIWKSDDTFESIDIRNIELFMFDIPFDMIVYIIPATEYFTVFITGKS